MFREIDPIMKRIIKCGTRTVRTIRLKYPAAENAFSLTSKQSNLNLILSIAKCTLGGKEQELGHSAILINRPFEFKIHRDYNEPKRGPKPESLDESTNLAAS